MIFIPYLFCNEPFVRSQNSSSSFFFSPMFLVILCKSQALELKDQKYVSCVFLCAPESAPERCLSEFIALEGVMFPSL